MIRDALTQILLLTIALIVYATLYPFQFDAVPHEMLSWSAMDSRANLLDIVLNLLFFLPLGLVAGCRWRKQWGLLWVLAGSAILSASVEVLQAYIPGRYSSLKDIFLNTLGAFLGLLLAHLPIFDPPVLRPRLSPLLEDRGRRILMLLVLAYLYFPFLPHLRMARLTQIMHSWSAVNLMQFSVLEQTTLGFFVASLWSSKAGFNVQILLILLAPAQLLLINRAPQVDQVLGLMAGYSIGLAWRLVTPKPPAVLLAAISVVLMTYKELQPFEWISEAVNEFNWIPFQAAFSIGRADGFRIICLKAFVYWFTIRQICKATGASAPRVASIAALLVLLSEFAQQHIPGRTPETTDALICLMGGLLFLELGKFDDQGL